MSPHPLGPGERVAPVETLRALGAVPMMMVVLRTSVLQQNEPDHTIIGKARKDLPLIAPL